MKVIYHDVGTKILEDGFVVESNDIAGLMAILEATKKVRINKMEFRIDNYSLHYGSEMEPELHIDISLL
ncbi:MULTISPECIES: hypothetical protein [Bacillus cereus group]|uniref:Uncharacterized protein n=2 Tax=Bacillus cereus group TaxID=86661 RepID=A0A9W5K1Z0_BACC8|nr:MULTISPECIES: hypothetical protein [Bacillus cereus group]MCC2507622.1 hypothetical protein [Bacillus cereus]EJR11996.1 hypothetical protein IIA_05831 [Bacillus cereus VD014]EJR71819.1 hypothetical protein IK7_06143 [Bacillus cereus VD156]MCU5276238.1 hypothetical protein [Bacillus cereus]OPD40026.1 hypothetical protein BVF97_31470 [Bacillus thuringiensis]